MSSHIHNCINSHINMPINNNINNHLNSHQHNHKLHHLVGHQTTTVAKAVGPQLVPAMDVVQVNNLNATMVGLSNSVLHLLGQQLEAQNSMTQMLQDLLRAHQDSIHHVIIAINFCMIVAQIHTLKTGYRIKKNSLYCRLLPPKTMLC